MRLVDDQQAMAPRAMRGAMVILSNLTTLALDFVQPSGCATPELPQAFSLPAIVIEVNRIEPKFERCLACGPLGVEHREPCGVAIPAFDNHVLSEDAFEGEPVSQCRAPRWRVLGI